MGSKDSPKVGDDHRSGVIGLKKDVTLMLSED